MKKKSTALEHLEAAMGQVKSLVAQVVDAVAQDISSLTADDVGAAAKGHAHTASQVGALPSSGGTLTGDLRIQSSGKNYGNKINLGDGDYVHFYEPADDCLEIKAKKINFVVSDTSDARFTLNGAKINEKGDTGATGAKGDKGDTGDTGPKGDKGLFYGTCDTAGSTAAKVAALTGFSLEDGAVVTVKFTNANTASSPTLNVNDTGAKSIKKYGTTGSVAYMWQAGEVVEFVYDGTNWIMVHGGTATTTYYGVTKLSSSVTSTSTALAATPSAVKQAYDLAASKQSKPLKGSLTIPTSGWSTDSTTGYTKYYDIAVSDVTANDRADVIIAAGSVQAAADCGLCPVSETLAGKVRIRAAKVPAAAISAEYWIEKE